MMIPKFRAWDKQLKRWTKYEITDDLQRFYGKDKDCWYCDIYNHRFKLLQSTGLTDINDNEIFEGDIVKVETRGGVVYGDVKYKSCSFMICSEDMDRIMLDCWDYEVIGNIYANPELMEGER